MEKVQIFLNEFFYFLFNFKDKDYLMMEEGMKESLKMANTTDKV